MAEPAPTGLLLDTHVLLWLYKGDSRLGPTARLAIEQTELVVVSVVSLMEIAIKSSLGKLRASVLAVGAQVRHDGLARMDLTDTHLTTLETLEWPGAHRDPFDRMLVSQAMVEGLTLVTADRVLDEYRVSTLEARA